MERNDNRTGRQRNARRSARTHARQRSCCTAVSSSAGTASCATNETGGAIPSLTPAHAQRYRLRAAILKALAHPTRLYLADVLSKQEMCVCDLTALVGLDISTVSKHLAVLRNAGLVADRRDGTQIFYRLVAPCVLRIFDCVEEAIREQIQQRMGVLHE